MTRTRVLVTGANGFVGSSLLRAFLHEGREAVGLVRADRAGLAEGPRRRAIEAWDESSLRRVVAGSEAVVHAASVVHRPDAPEAEYVRFNVDGTRALVDACLAEGVTRFVFFSTIKVYGEDTRGILDEETAPAPVGGYAKTKLEAEQLVLAAGRSETMRPIVLRLAPVFGPGDKGNVRTLIRAISRGRFVMPGDGNTRKSLVHISTVSRVASAALDSDTTGTFVLADRVVPSVMELVTEIARATNSRRPLRVPAPVVRAVAAGVGAGLRALGRSTSISGELVDKSLTPSVCCPAKIERELGVPCHADLTEAIREEVDWLRRERLI
jgi:UDP-glucose 4-epimerase